MEFCIGNQYYFSMASRVSNISETLFAMAWSLFTQFYSQSTIQYRRTQVVTFGTPGEVELDRREVIQHATDIGYSKSDSHWVKRSGFIRPRATWSIETLTDESGSKNRVLVETLSLPKNWLYILVGGCLLSLVWIYLPFSLIWWAVAVSGSLCFTTLFLFMQSPLDVYLDTLREADNPDTVLRPQEYKTSCSGPAITASVAGLLSSGPLFLTGLPLLWEAITSSEYVGVDIIGDWLVVLVIGGVWMISFWVLGLLSGLLIYWYEDSDVRLRVFPFDLLTNLNLPTPELSGGYVTLVVAATIPAAVLTFSSFFLPVITHMNTIQRRLYFLTPPMYITISLLAFLYWWTVRNRKYVYDQTIAKLADQQTRRAKLRTIGLTTLASYGLGVVLILFIDKFQSFFVWPILNLNPTPLVRSPVTVVILMIAILPIAYFLFGIAYQVWSVIAIWWQVAFWSRPVGSSSNVGATIRILDSDTLNAFAYGIGPVQSIIISTRLLEVFDTDEETVKSEGFQAPLTALIAHEEAHLDPTANDYWLTDAAVSILAPLGGLLTLTGKNIIYALFNFRDRETKADRYAVEKTTPDELVTALETLREATGASSVSSSISFLPTASSAQFVRASRPSSLTDILHRYYGLLFGSFALARAHPDIADRINAITEDA